MEHIFPPCMGTFNFLFIFFNENSLVYGVKHRVSYIHSRYTLAMPVVLLSSISYVSLWALVLFVHLRNYIYKRKTDCHMHHIASCTFPYSHSSLLLKNYGSFLLLPISFINKNMNIYVIQSLAIKGSSLFNFVRAIICYSNLCCCQ